MPPCSMGQHVDRNRNKPRLQTLHVTHSVEVSIKFERVIEEQLRPGANSDVRRKCCTKLFSDQGPRFSYTLDKTHIICHARVVIGLQGYCDSQGEAGIIPLCNAKLGVIEDQRDECVNYTPRTFSRVLEDWGMRKDTGVLSVMSCLELSQ